MTEPSRGTRPEPSGTRSEAAGTRPEPSGGGLPDYLDMPLHDFLGQLALAQAAPGGGSAAALAVTLAASLCEMTARLSGSQLGDHVAAELAGQAEQAAVSCGRLITADAAAYAQVIRAMRGKPAAGGGLGGAGSHAVTAALSAASDVPLQVVEIAAEIGGIAERLAISGNPNLRGDAAAAALLAQAGARAAANMVKINLTGKGGPAGRAGLPSRTGQHAPGPPADDGRLTRAARLLAGLARSVARLRLPG